MKFVLLGGTVAPVDLTMVAIVAIVAVTVASVAVIVLLRWIVARLSPRSQALLGFAFAPQVHLYVRSMSAQRKGQPEEAVRLARKLLEAKSPFIWEWANCAVNAMVHAGLYKEALGVTRRWSKSALERERRRDLPGYLLVQVNRAEALYNLGRFGCAKKLLAAITADCDTRGTPLVRAGLAVQKAWLSVLMGEPEAALELARRVDERDLPPAYRAELYFTRAAAFRDLGRYAEAQIEAQLGAETSERASSKRNAFFLLGSIAAAQGQSERACALLEQGAGHDYRGQGADGLFLLGELYSRSGKSADARRAYEAAYTRDPQAVAARWAREAARK